MKDPLRLVILAAGQSKRFLSQTSKILHPLAGKPILDHVLTTAAALEPEELIVVASHALTQDPLFQRMVQGRNGRVVVQDEPRGTADALLYALEHSTHQDANLLVLMGDAPLVPALLLHQLVDRPKTAHETIGLVAMRPDDPKGYGRCLLDDKGFVKRIVEEKDANPAEKAETLCHTGVMWCAPAAIDLLTNIPPSPATKELYLTALIEHALFNDQKTFFIEGSAKKFLGINTKADLAHSEALLQDELRAEALARGVTFKDPASTFLACDTQLDADVVIDPFVVFGPGVVIEKGAHIKSFCTLSHTHVEKNAVIGPSAHLSEKTHVGQETVLGNFVEVKRSTLGKKVKAKHHTYLGDATLKDHVLVGAGTITCNFDGAKKHQTVLEENAFIGSNTALIAPLTIGKNAFVAAGSTLTQNVPSDTLAVARAKTSLHPCKKKKNLKTL